MVGVQRSWDMASARREHMGVGSGREIGVCGSKAMYSGKGSADGTCYIGLVVERRVLLVVKSLSVNTRG